METLRAWKKEIDGCEHVAFEAWRTTTNKRTSEMLVNEHILYHNISMSIQSQVNSLLLEASSVKANSKRIPNSVFKWKRRN